MGWFSGSKPKNKQLSLLEPGQQGLKKQLIAAGEGEGAGGAFGGAADYYRDLLSDDSQTAQMMQAPEMRRFNEQIVPDLAEQFAGMGAGNLSSSGFRNAAVSAGTDLSERLGAIRAQLRQQGAQGLQNIGSQGLQQFSENVQTPGTPGFASQIGPIAGNIVGGLAAGPAGAMASNALFGSGGGANQSPNGWLSAKGQGSPYGPNNQMARNIYDSSFSRM